VVVWVLVGAVGGGGWQEQWPKSTDKSTRTHAAIRKRSSTG